MSNQCILTGVLPLQKGVTKEQVEQALLLAIDQGGADLSKSDIQGLMSADKWADEHLSVSPGQVDIAVNFRGRAGYRQKEPEVIAKAFDSLVEDHGWLTSADLETASVGLDAMMFYPIGPTPEAKRTAQMLYGFSLAQPFLESAGLHREAMDFLKSSALNQISSAEPMMQVSLDGGVTFLPAREGVRVIVQGQESEEGPVDLHFNLTQEGVVTDLWAGDAHVGTDAVPYDDTVSRLYDDSDDVEPQQNTQAESRGVRLT